MALVVGPPQTHTLDTKIVALEAQLSKLSAEVRRHCTSLFAWEMPRLHMPLPMRVRLLPVEQHHHGVVQGHVPA